MSSPQPGSNAEAPAEIPYREAFKAMTVGTPQEKMQAAIDFSLKSDPWFSLVTSALKIVSVDAESTPKTCTYAYTVQKSSCNFRGFMNGGAVATLLDFCTGVALCLVNAPKFWETTGITRNLQVTYLKPAMLGDELLIECEIIQATRRFATIRGVIKSKKDGTVLAICEQGKVDIPEPAKI